MRLACPAIFLFLSVMLSEAKHLWMSFNRARKEINLRFFASLRMTERLPPSLAAAQDFAKQTASDLPTYPIAGRAHCAFNR
jgi:hypothetical protein